MKSYLASFLTGLFLLVSCKESLAAGPTYVNAGIAVSTEWTKDNSPYVIQSDVMVSRGAVLTIDPGVEVQFVA